MNVSFSVTPCKTETVGGKNFLLLVESVIIIKDNCGAHTSCPRAFKYKQDNQCSKQRDLLGGGQMYFKQTVQTYFNTTAYFPPSSHTKLFFLFPNAFKIFARIRYMVVCSWALKTFKLLTWVWINGWIRWISYQSRHPIMLTSRDSNKNKLFVVDQFTLEATSFGKWKNVRTSHSRQMSK